MLQTVMYQNVPNIFHHGRTSLYNVYKTLINNDHLSYCICCLKIEAIRIQVSEVTGFSLFQMVYHTEPPNFKFALQR